MLVENHKNLINFEGIPNQRPMRQLMNIRTTWPWHTIRAVLRSGCKTMALSGNTGSARNKNSGGPHLHYEIRKERQYGTPVNPESFIYSRFDKNNGWTLINPCR